MTGRISDFGSLTDRTRGGSPGQAARASSAPSPAADRDAVRHAWLDGDVPVLVARWRRTEHGGWEGLVVGVTPNGPATTWIIAGRLRPVSDSTPSPATGPRQPDAGGNDSG